MKHYSRLKRIFSLTIQIVLILILLVGLYYLLLGTILPRVLEKGIPYFAKKILIKPVSIRSVTIDPLTLRTVLSGIRIHEADTSFLSISKIALRIDPVTSLVKQEIHFSELSIDSLKLNIEYKTDSTFTHEHLLRPRKKTSTKPKKSFPIGIAILNFNAGVISFTNHNQTVNEPYLISPINFSMNDFSTKKSGDSANYVNISMNFQTGAQLETDGYVQFSPLKIQGKIVLSDFNLTRIQDRIGVHLPFVITNGTVDLHTEYTLEKNTIDGHPPIKFMLRNGYATAHNLHIQEKRDHSTILHVQKLSVHNVGLCTAVDRSLTADSVKIDGGIFEFAREIDGVISLKKNFNFDDLVKTFPILKKLGGRFKHYRFDIKKSLLNFDSFTFRDETFRTPIHHSLTSMNLEIKNLHKEPVGEKAAINSDFRFDLNSSYNHTGSVNLNGTGSLVPFLLDSRLTVEKISVSSLQGIISILLAADIDGGTLTGDLRMTVNPAQKNEKFVLRGNLAMDDFALRDKLEGSRFLSMKKLALSDVALKIPARSLDIQKVTMVSPTIDLYLTKKRQMNIQAMRIARDTRLFKKVRTKKSPFNFSVETLYLKGFNANIKDFSNAFSFAATLHNLDGVVTGFSTKPNADVRFDLHGAFGKYASIRGKGNVQPFNPILKAQLTFYARGFELPMFSPYLEKYAGVPIEHGTLETTLKYSIVGDSIWGDNRIILDNVSFGDEKAVDGKKVDIPFKLAIAILQDEDGIVSLSAPISGTLEDPKFELVPLVFKSIGLGLSKAVAAPFFAISNISKKNQIEQIDFPKGSLSLTTLGDEKLQEITRIASKKPDLEILILGMYDPQHDAEAIQQSALISRLGIRVGRTDANERNISSAIYREYLLNYYGKVKGISWSKEFAQFAQSRKDTLSTEPELIQRETLLTEFTQAKFDQLIQEEPITDEAIAAFCRKRAEVVYSKMTKVHGMNPDNIRIVTEVSEKVKPGHYVYISADLKEKKE